jgi:lactate dehydrogenase-like 2-hydroxyacid dehydrogenase
MSEFTRITRKEMDVAPVLKDIIVDGVGYDHIDVEASKEGKPIR